MPSSTVEMTLSFHSFGLSHAQESFSRITIHDMTPSAPSFNRLRQRHAVEHCQIAGKRCL
jgi:hypothetical protein